MTADILTTTTNYALVALLFTAVWAPLLISLLYKLDFKIKQTLTKDKSNAEFIKIHGHKAATPSMGGLMISVTAIVLSFVFLPDNPLRNLLLIGWSLFMLYGLADNLLVIAKKADKDFLAFQETLVWRLGKLGLLFVFGWLVTYLAREWLGVTEITFWQGFVIPLTDLILPLVAFAIVVAMYGIEITDGADGLVTGQFLVAFFAYLVVAIVTGYITGDTNLLPYLGMLIGSSLVYLYFNINPARVYMGGTGTLPIAFTLILFAMITDTIPVFIIMGILFWVELFSSASQIIAIKFFKRKIFRIAPIHHHFEAIGWPEAKVVQRFWLASAVFALVALWVLGLMVA